MLSLIGGSRVTPKNYLFVFEDDVVDMIFLRHFLLRNIRDLRCSNSDPLLRILGRN